MDPERRHYVVATHSGITLARFLGWLVRSELVDGNTEGTLTPFRPDDSPARAMEAPAFLA